MNNYSHAVRVSAQLYASEKALSIDLFYFLMTNFNLNDIDKTWLFSCITITIGYTNCNVFS